MNRRVEYIQNTSAQEGIPFDADWQIVVDQKTKIAYSGFSIMAAWGEVSLPLRQDVMEHLMEEEIGPEVRMVAEWNREMEDWPWRERA